VLVVEVTDAADLEQLSDHVIDELLTHRAIFLTTMGEALPPALRARCQSSSAVGWGLYAKDVELGDREMREVLRRMLPRGAATESHYNRIVHLHIGGSADAASEFEAEGTEALAELLAHDGCALKSLDVSSADLDPSDLVNAIRANSSLTSLDVRTVLQMPLLYDELADALLHPGGRCRIGHLRCDSFEVVEGETALSLRERRLDPGSVRLLAGVLRHNRSLEDVDLAATGVRHDGADALSAALEDNGVLKVLRLQHNPSLDDSAKASLRAAAAMRMPGNALTLYV